MRDLTERAGLDQHRTSTPREVFVEGMRVRSECRLVGFQDHRAER